MIFGVNNDSFLDVLLKNLKTEYNLLETVPKKMRLAKKMPIIKKSTILFQIA